MSLSIATATITFALHHSQSCPPHLLPLYTFFPSHCQWIARSHSDSDSHTGSPPPLLMRLTHRRPLPLPLSLCSSRSSAAMPRSLSPSSASNGVVSDSFASDMPETALVVRRSLALFVFLAALFFVYNSVISFRFLLYSSSSTPSFLLSSSSSLSVVFPTDDEISLRVSLSLRPVCLKSVVIFVLHN